MFRRFDLASLPITITDDFRWLSAASALLSDKPDCLDLIHSVSGAIAGGDVCLAENDISRLISKRMGRLGHYFEALVQTVFSLSPEIDEWHANVQIFDGKLTKGEFDLLYKRGDFWGHLELAIKFYIGVGDLRDANNWHGPALRDNLGRKCRRLNEHQLRMPSTVAGREVLSGLGISEIKSEALVLGRLFHPRDNWNSAASASPPGISEDHPRGWWSFAANTPIGKGEHWYELSKPEWMAGRNQLSDGIPKTPDFVANVRPKMYAVCRKQNESFVEISRGFVVPDTWGPDGV